MIGCERPEALLLLLPALALLFLGRRREGRDTGEVLALRVLLALLVVLLLARPYRAAIAEGRDLVLVVDRSRSVPAEGEGRAIELARLAAGSAQAGDRLGVVSFGRDAVVERSPQEPRGLDAWSTGPDRDATDVAAALETALSLLPRGRQGSLLLLSDGENTGRDPLPIAREAARRGVRVDVVPLRRASRSDVALLDLQLPASVAPGEPFQWTAWIWTDRALTAPVRLLRDGQLLAESERQLTPGTNRLLFRDRVTEPGLHRYEVEVLAPDDRVPENDRALGLLLVEGGRSVLVITPRGREDRLTRSLQAAGIPLRVLAPEAAPLSADGLDDIAAVVLENVPAGDLLPGGTSALADFVRHFGGGLLMTGGRASFGSGGWRHSPVEDVLPVSLEVRQEQRRFALAMAIALDRSGSMSAPVGDGLLKMDLANQGACAAVELLAPIDTVAVLAVDSSAHVVVEATQVADVSALRDDILSIESGGGGIFVGEALHACADQLADAPQRNRHIVLFADAADAEEPDDYRTFVPRLREAGVTVSVIGLGSDTDSDAALLREVAELGGGRCFFTTEPADLPRVFAEETITVARSSLVEEPTAGEVLADILAVADLPRGPFPTLGGYSIAWLKTSATPGVVSLDDQHAPLFSFQQAGLGRAAAFLGEADGDLSGELATWEAYGDFFGTLVRWLAGSDAGAPVFVDFTRAGHEAVLSVETTREDEARLARVQAWVAGPQGEPAAVRLQRAGPGRLEARVPLDLEGSWRALVDDGDGHVLRSPPVALPYSPEYEPATDTESDERLLRAIADSAGGRVDPPSSALFEGPRAGAGITDLGPLLGWLALAALLLEIAARRLDLRLPRWTFATTLRARITAWRARHPADRKRATPEPKAAPDLATPARDIPPEAPVPQPGALRDALEEARRRARRR